MSTKYNHIGIVLIILCLSFLVSSILVMSSVPPVDRDALTHHLAVPKLWIENGGIVAIPHLVFSYYPMNVDLLYVFPMLFGNDIIPKYIHFLFALGTAWFINSYLKQRTSRALAMLGALLFLSTPVIVKLSTTVYVDLGLIFFSWAAMAHLFAWGRNEKSLKHLIVSAIFCGLGLGTKYNGMITLVLLTLFVPMVYIRTASSNQFKTKLAIGYPILFFLIALTTFSPWMIRNYNLTGNPIYPLYDHHISSQGDNSSISNMSMKPWLQRKLIYRETAWETALIPIRIFFQGQDDNPRFFDGKLNPILCLFPLILLIRRKGADERLKLELSLLSLYSVLFVFYASFMVDMRIRYIAPIIPSLVVLSVFGIGAAQRWIDGIEKKGIQILSRGLLISSLVGALFMNAHYISALYQSVNPWPYVSGKISRENYLREKLPEFDAIQFVNQIQSDNTKIMALFVGKRLYYFDKPVQFATQLFAASVADSSDDTSLSANLQNIGFSHAMIGIQHFETWANQVFDANQKTIVSQWLRNGCQLLYSKNGYAVFKLTQDDAIRSSLIELGWMNWLMGTTRCQETMAPEPMNTGDVLTFDGCFSIGKFRSVLEAPALWVG